jgi:hypothetical protein
MVRSRRYAEAFPIPLSVNEAMKQYTMMKRASDRVGPLGLRKASRISPRNIIPSMTSPTIPWSW